MSKSRLLNWLSSALLLGRTALLILSLIIFFNACSTHQNNVSSSSPQITATVSSSTVSSIPDQPDSTPLSSPPPTPTRMLPTSTPTPTPPTATPPPAAAFTFDGDMAYEHVLAQVEFGPRPTGSEAGWAMGDFIMAELDEAGWPNEAQEFIFKGVKGRNIIGKMGSGPIIIVGAHYDTRPAADQDPDPAKRGEWIEGANDGASGVAVLLELARVLEPDKLKNEIWLAFFDAEDRGRLEEWPFSVGARHMAETLTVNPQSAVVVDMIGDADQQIFFESNSTEALRQEIWAVAAELGYETHIIPQFKHTIIDDHIPFLERGIPAVDMIDFDYPYWHTVADTADKVSPESLERVGRTLEVWVEEKQ